MDGVSLSPFRTRFEIFLCFFFLFFFSRLSSLERISFLPVFSFRSFSFWVISEGSLCDRREQVHRLEVCYVLANFHFATRGFSEFSMDVSPNFLARKTCRCEKLSLAERSTNQTTEFRVARECKAPITFSSCLSPRSW